MAKTFEDIDRDSRNFNIGYNMGPLVVWSVITAIATVTGLAIWHELADPSSAQDLANTLTEKEQWDGIRYDPSVARP